MLVPVDCLVLSMKDHVEDVLPGQNQTILGFEVIEGLETGEWLWLQAMQSTEYGIRAKDRASNLASCMRETVGLVDDPF